jgi:hypothetical protein
MKRAMSKPLVRSTEDIGRNDFGAIGNASSVKLPEVSKTLFGSGPTQAGFFNPTHAIATFSNPDQHRTDMYFNERHIGLKRPRILVACDLLVGES